MSKKWYYQKDGKQVGPVSSNELKRLANAGEITGDHLVRAETMERWRKARSVRGLTKETASTGPPPLPTSSESKEPEPTGPPPLPRATPQPLSEHVSKLHNWLNSLNSAKFPPNGLAIGIAVVLGLLAVWSLVSWTGVLSSKSGAPVAIDDVVAFDESGVPVFTEIDYANDFSNLSFETPAGATPRTIFEQFAMSGDRFSGKWLEAEGYTDSEGKWLEHGHFTIWHDKQKTRKYESGTALHNQHHGIHYEYHSDGSVRAEQPFVGGKQHGVTKMWHKNGQLEFLGHKLLGKSHGVQKAWYPNGKKDFEGYFANDKRVGPFKKWWPSGNPKMHLNYVDGLQHGEQSEFADGPDQLVIEHGQFQNGVRVGKWRRRFGFGTGYFVEVDVSGPWTTGTKDQFMARLWYAMQDRGINVSADLRGRAAHFSFDSTQQFKDKLGAPASDVQDMDWDNAPNRSRYRIWDYSCDDGNLRLWVRPDNSQSGIIVSARKLVR